MMKSVSGVGVGLSLVFACLLLALVAELYYLLWWKKRKSPTRRIARGNGDFRICGNGNHHRLCSTYSINLVHEPQSNPRNQKQDLISHQQALQNPRFLFTIAEETKEDLESEDGGITSTSWNGSKRLGDLFQILQETPFFTPIASSPYFTPPLTPHQGEYEFPLRSFSPFFECTADAAFNKLTRSPPPKLKFLRDAEEKLLQKTKSVKETGESTANLHGSFVANTQEEEIFDQESQQVCSSQKFNSFVQNP